MTDTHSQSVVDARDTVASGAIEQPTLDVEASEGPSTELTGTPVGATPAPAPSSARDEEPAGGFRRLRRSRGGRTRGKPKEHLAEAVIEEIDSARAEHVVAEPLADSPSEPELGHATAEDPTEAGAPTFDYPVNERADLGSEVESAGNEGDEPPSRMLVAPPAHSATRDASVPTWTFGSDEAPAANSADADTQAAVIPGRVDPEVPGAATPAPMSTAEPDAPMWTGDDVATVEPAGLRRASFGPTGKRRRPAVVVLLSILTLGLYHVAWFGKVNREMGDFDPRMHVYSGRSTWAIVPPWLVGLGASAVGGAVLVARYVSHTTLPFSVDTPSAIALALGLLLVPYCTLLLPFSVVATVMTMERVRVVEEHVGMTSDVQLRPARTLARLMIPVIGGFSATARQQRRLNAVWDVIAPQEGRGRRRG